MGVIKTRAEAKANFEAAIPQIASRYTAGVMKADWLTAAGSDQAEQNFNAAMSAVLSAKSRQNKIRTMSNADWQKGASEKGAPIIGERIRKALPKWEQNWGQMYDQVSAIIPTLPPRTIDPMTNIDNRLKTVVQAWRHAAGRG